MFLHGSGQDVGNQVGMAIRKRFDSNVMNDPALFKIGFDFHLEPLAKTPRLVFVINCQNLGLVRYSGNCQVPINYFQLGGLHFPIGIFCPNGFQTVLPKLVAQSFVSN